jgi:hypothetical protein
MALVSLASSACRSFVVSRFNAAELAAAVQSQIRAIGAPTPSLIDLSLGGSGLGGQYSVNCTVGTSSVLGVSVPNARAIVRCRAVHSEADLNAFIDETFVELVANGWFYCGLWVAGGGIVAGQTTLALILASEVPGTSGAEGPIRGYFRFTSPDPWEVLPGSSTPAILSSSYTVLQADSLLSIECSGNVFAADVSEAVPAILGVEFAMVVDGVPIAGTGLVLPAATVTGAQYETNFTMAAVVEGLAPGPHLIEIAVSTEASTDATGGGAPDGFLSTEVIEF